MKKRAKKVLKITQFLRSETCHDVINLQRAVNNATIYYYIALYLFLLLQLPAHTELTCGICTTLIIATIVLL